MQELNDPIVGIRAWYLFPRNDKTLNLREDEAQAGLYSTFARIGWSPGVNQAKCLDIVQGLDHHACKQAPGALCQCGLYAYHNLAICDTQWTNHFIGTYGIVRGWGSVYLHPQGWRAQYAEVLALIVNRPQESQFPLGRQRILRQIAKTFGVPTISHKSVDAIISEFGDPVPEEMWPKAYDNIDIDTL